MKKKKILVVDDEQHIVRIIQVNLEQAGYDVITASNGVEALKKVREERPDMVMLDDLMPAMNGAETLKNLKANPETSDIPVMMIIATQRENTGQKTFQFWQSGADCILTKPFNNLEVLTFVKRILRSVDENKDSG